MDGEGHELGPAEHLYIKHGFKKIRRERLSLSRTAQR